MLRVRRSAFTLIELLVVIAIVAILMGMLLPAVQKIRESSHKAACENNLKQLALALRCYENDHDALPPNDWKLPGEIKHGWGTLVLPYIEQRPLAERYDFTVGWSHANNKDVVLTHIKTFQCLSSPHNPRVESITKIDKKTGKVKESWTGSTSDYFSPHGAHDKLVQLGLTTAPNDYSGVMFKSEDKGVAQINRLSMCTDGLSQTILVAECAGRPQLYRGRKKIDTTNQDEIPDGGPWAANNNGFKPEGSSSDGAVKHGPCMINCTNRKNIYSFHVGGANAAFADGSVRFLYSGMSVGTVNALLTRAGGEVLGNDY